MKLRKKFNFSLYNTLILTYSFSLLISLFLSCSASNCPLESNVTCNYGFYDSEGSPIKINDEITISTLLPGSKTVYIYKRLNESTVTLDSRDESYIAKGYSETISIIRRDTVLLNKISGASSIKVPMSYHYDKDTIIISYASITNKDTLYISHKSYTHIDLPECGTKQFHKLKDIKSTDSGIFNTEIVNSDVNYDGNENIKIYFNGVAE